MLWGLSGVSVAVQVTVSLGDGFVAKAFLRGFI